MIGGRVSRAGALGFIATWIAVQVAVPLLRKFELPSLRYRHATFSWAMFPCA
jgi:hypothetical protein